MSRRPEYSIEDVFERAIPIVLAQGYRGCSMSTLITQTQFNRRAFYLNFGNKQSFISALLAYYIEHKLLPIQYLLNQDDNHGSAILNYFKAYQDLIDQQGCLLVRLILELGNEDEHIQSLARHYYDNLQFAFIACIEKAIAQQTLPLQTPVESLALKLSCFAQGFAVSNNLQEGQSDIQIVINSLLK